MLEAITPFLGSILVPTTDARLDKANAAELRAMPRKSLFGPGRLLVGDSIQREINTVDISLGGIGILVTEPLAAEDECVLAIDVLISDAIKRINIWGKVVYCLSLGVNQFKVGVRFKDADSISKMHITLLCTPQLF